jgi:hypothetical protein
LFASGSPVAQALVVIVIGGINDDDINININIYLSEFRSAFLCL